MTLAYVPQSIKLLLVNAKAATVSGVATALIKVPEDREITGGEGCFLNQATGDSIQAFVTDEDNVLGYGAGFVVSAFQDTLVPAANQGYYMLGNNPVKIAPLVNDDPSVLPANLYLKIVATKADLSADTLFINIFWGKRLR